MNLKKKIKGFFTLTRKADGGFTLVELIVVIAILAILAGVAVPAYSGYMKQANMQADRTLVSDVANALMLQYYADTSNATDGYVILTVDGASVDVANGFAAKAMTAAYGDSWPTTAALKYSDWTDAGMLDYVLANKDSSALVANSTYMTKSTPAKLVSTFSGITDAMSVMVSGQTVDPLTKVESLGAMSADQIAAMRTELGTLGVSWDSTEGADNSAYSTAVSNLMVKYVADEVGSVGASGQGTQPSMMAMMAVQYSAIYAWASSGDPDGEAMLADMDAAIAAGNGGQAVMDAILGVDMSQGSPLYNYMQSTDAQNDGLALVTIMGAVSDISDGLSMTESGLYGSDAIAGLVNNYTSAIAAVANVTDTSALANIPDGAVVVFVTASGTVSVVPAEAYLAGK